MDALIKKGDSQLWPLRFDRNKRVWPVPRGDVEFIYYGPEALK